MNKIGIQLALAVGLISVVIIGIFSVVMDRAQRRTLISQVEKNAQQLSDTIKSSTKYDMLLNQRDSVHQIIDTIGTQKGIVNVRVYNKEGRIIYSSGKLEIGSLVDKKAEACYACHELDGPMERLPIHEQTRIFRSRDQSRNLGIINPIYNEPGCWLADCHAHPEAKKVLGVLDVTMSLASVDSQLRTNRIQTLVFAVSAVLSIGLLLWLIVRQVVLKPVRQIVKATDQVSKGNLAYKIDVRRDDEIGALARSFNDMTRKLDEAQRQVVQSQKLASLGRLAAGIAHELNNPLTGVLTYSSYLLKRAGEQPEMKEDLDVIVRETTRCREIVKELLDFARPVPVQNIPVRINESILRALKVMEHHLDLNHITVVRELAEDLPEIIADPNQLQQVFINLFVNASDAMMPNGGTLTVRSERSLVEDRECVRVRVSDTGCGIPQEHLANIFDPFYTTKGQKGTGLGLAVVWGILSKRNDRIHVSSEVGKGTTFLIDFYLKASHHPQDKL